MRSGPGIEAISTMNVIYSTATAILLLFCLASAGSSGPTAQERSIFYEHADCSDGWRITGYYTPVEDDFKSGETREIEIAGVGKETFNAEFLKTIFDDDEGFGEGWGKTRFGWYLGKYSGRWHKADAPLDANDKPLEPNAVAVDNKVIPAGSIVNIPDLPGDLGKLEFKSTDVGVSVHGKHVDVYTGEGRDARRRMYQFTFEEDDKGLKRVCFSPAASH